jgi:hypothetical protein
MVSVAAAHNNLLSEAEQQSVRSLITTCEDEHRGLDLEITRVQDVLSKLLSKYEIATTQIRSYRVAIAPHRALPREILSEIFLHAVPERVFVVVPEGHYLTTAPYSILLVCSLWRDVAMGTRGLWNNLEVDLTLIAKIRNFAKHTGNILSRSEPSLISLKIVGKDVHDYPIPLQVM